MSKTKGISFLLIATILYSFQGVISRKIGINFGVFYQAFARNIIVFIIISTFVFLTRKWKKIAKSDVKWFLGMSLPGIVATISFFIAFNYLRIGIGYFIYFSISTIASYFLARIFFQEEFTRERILSLVLGVIGLVLIFYHTFEGGNWLYSIFAFLAGGGAAAWNVLSKKISHKYSTAQILAVDTFITFPLCLIMAFLLKESMPLPTFNTQWLFVIIYAFVAIVTYTFIILGFKNLQAQISSLILLTEPVFGAILGYLIYTEELTLLMIIGGTFILIGVSLPHLLTLRKIRT